MMLIKVAAMIKTHDTRWNVILWGFFFPVLLLQLVFLLLVFTHVANPDGGAG